MICPKCNTVNTPQAGFCKNCGTQLTIFPLAEANDNNKTINLFCIYLGILALQSLFYLVMTRFFRSTFGYGTDRFQIYNNILEGSGWVFSIGGIILLILLCANIKHANIRTWIIIFTVVQAIVFVVWRILPLFSRAFSSF